MARTLLLFPLLLGLACQAQDYLANSPIWRVHSTCAVPSPCLANDDYTYRTVGDTLIDGTVWTKLVREGSVSFQWNGSFPVPQDCQGTYTYGPDYYGTTLIRQAGRQLRILDAGTDQLLYEFDLQVGDTLPSSWSNWSNSVTVVGVDSILIGTEMRARYALGNSWADYLIEGVGSSHGLLEPITDFFDCGYSLECFGLDTAGFYPVVENVPCDISMGLAARPVPVRPAAYPNPGTDHITVQLPPGRHVVTLLDATGRSVLEQRTAEQQPVVRTDGLSPGIYLLRMDNGPGIRWVKE